MGLEQNQKLKELIDEGIVGIDHYTEPRQTGGQHVGSRSYGTRIWMPKDSELPDVDIRIRYSRSQYENRELAITLFELVTGI